MHLMLKHVLEPNCWMEPSPREGFQKGESAAPWRTTEAKSAPPAEDDLYRDDPYRFEGDADAARESPGDDLRRIDYIPTPAEIAGTCAEIRATWSKCEKRRRYVGQLPAEALDDAMWAPPVIDMSHFRAATVSSLDAV